MHKACQACDACPTCEDESALQDFTAAMDAVNVDLDEMRARATLLYGIMVLRTGFCKTGFLQLINSRQPDLSPLRGVLLPLRSTRPTPSSPLASESRICGLQTHLGLNVQ